MFINQIKSAMNMVAALSAFIAAALWWYASFVMVGWSLCGCYEKKYDI